MRTSTACVSVLVASGFVLVASYAVAQVISNSDRVVISGNDRTATEFPSPNFHPLDQSFAESGEAVSLSPFSALIGIRSGVHNATFNTAVTLIEPDGTASDFVVLSAVATPTGVQSWTLNFFSDAESGLPKILLELVGPPTTVLENGTLQDISGLFLNSDGVSRIDPLFSIMVQSDLEAVPEPATWLLLGSGLLGGVLDSYRQA